MAIATLEGHISRAVDFSNKRDLFFVIGKISPWESEQSPPAPNELTVVGEVIGYKRVEQVVLVVQDESGELLYEGTRWRLCTEADAYIAGAVHVYVDTVLTSDELPLQTFRQVGLVSSLSLKSETNPNKYHLLPSEVDSPGVLQVVSNRVPVARQLGQSQKLSFIISF